MPVSDQFIGYRPVRPDFEGDIFVFQDTKMPLVDNHLDKGIARIFGDFLVGQVGDPADFFQFFQ